MLRSVRRRIDLISKASLISFTFLATLVATVPPAVGQTEDCSILGQTTFVADALDEFYLWYREIPDLNPALFDSPEAYLEAARYRPLDESFSYITGRAASEAYYSNSQFIGIGFAMKQTGPTEIRISQVFPLSPASEAGFVRGDYLVAVNGKPVPDLIETGQLGTELGPNEDGYPLELTRRMRRGGERTVTVTKRPVTIPTVSQTEVFDLNGLPVGYIHFRNFVEPSIPALDAAFAKFRARGVTDVILDLRYNGGGLISVAQHLGGLIGGTGTSDRVFVEFIHNDKNTFRNQSILFEDPPEALDLRRLVVITTRASASASELVINALDPFIPVTVVGDTTYGKPVGQYGIEFCDKVLFPVSFRSANAMGQSDFFNGFPADCPAGDDLNRPLGNLEEDSLAEALHFLETGACSNQSVAAGRVLTQRRMEQRAIARDGWHRLINAW
jgi:C-terminal processing protease CtpA/Prc